MRRIFTQAVARDERSFHSLFIEHAPCGNRGGENGRLCNFCQAKLIFWTFKTEFRQPIAEGCVSFFECLPRNRKLLSEIFSHTDGLRSLAGKEKCELMILHKYLNAKASGSPDRRASLTPSEGPRGYVTSSGI